jgi:6-pyruvoyltetrahydropterin/6-carboxytetrahydropterin synthase
VTHEVGLSRQVNAFHVMPGMQGPEGQLHDHDYRIEVVVGREQLDSRAMVCDLDVLEAALADVLARIDGKDLETIRPDHVEAVTVEVFARWVHETLAEPVRVAGGETLAVRVWESPVAFGGYRAAISV